MDDFASGFPLPPFFYRNYSFNNASLVKSEVCGRLSPSGGNDGAVAVKDETVDQSRLISGPTCPPTPKGSWISFGIEEKLTTPSHELDSETLITVEDADPDPRVQFKALYRDFMNSLLLYLGRLKDMDPDSVSDIKRFLKIYMNLQHMLSSFSERKAEDDIIRMLREQLRRRRHYIDCLKVALVNVNQLLSR
ncbi:RNA polymerase II mediator complex protein, putative [Babesia ovis]|uniref:Mediator of RNA polymerase II transcription subunit 7 n=1 Tax=Babesia ovis TaxID=5869 RepID=A0A9W5WWH9_BABOV|nr:RNA polymerase II mediator complex protein, putative [Babesia ovis]